MSNWAELDNALRLYTEVYGTDGVLSRSGRQDARAGRAKDKAESKIVWQALHYLRFTIHHFTINACQLESVVVFYIILCLEIGIFLTVLPWWPQGMLGLSDWGNNYFLFTLSQDWL